MFILAAYDIADEKRLKRVAIIMEDYGARVQKSVFECLIDNKQFIKLIGELEQVIDNKLDTVRFYRLCGNCQQVITILGAGAVTTDPDVYII